MESASRHPARRSSVGPSASTWLFNVAEFCDHTPEKGSLRPAGALSSEGMAMPAMHFHQELHEDCGCSAYVVGSRATHEVAVVDPAIDIQPYLDLSRQHGFRMTYVVDTHIHADHVSGARALAAATGAELRLHRDADVRYPFHELEDGDELHLGQVRLRVLHTPGHRPEAISLLVINEPRSPEPSMV